MCRTFLSEEDLSADCLDAVTVPSRVKAPLNGWSNSILPFYVFTGANKHLWHHVRFSILSVQKRLKSDHSPAMLSDTHRFMSTPISIRRVFHLFRATCRSALAVDDGAALRESSTRESAGKGIKHASWLACGIEGVE